MAEVFQISNLTQQAQWVPAIAGWHHQEWLRTHEGLEGRHRSSEALQGKLTQREASLSAHINEETLPVTFVAHRGNFPLGTVSLVYYQFTNDKKPSEWLTNLFVLPDFRRQGIADRLLKHALAYAQAQNLPRLMLYTSSSANFYHKRQWRRVNRGIVQGLKVDIMDYKLC